MAWSPTGELWVLRSGVAHTPVAGGRSLDLGFMATSGGGSRPTLSVVGKATSKSVDSGRTPANRVIPPSEMSDVALCRLIQRSLTSDLLKGEYANLGSLSPVAGHCYVASEAYYWLRGGKEAGYVSMHQVHEGVSHWWVKNPVGKIIDPTSAQFVRPVDYAKGRPYAFICPTSPPHPSARAVVLMERVRAAMEVSGRGTEMAR